jgi:hypothetical protein
VTPLPGFGDADALDASLRSDFLGANFAACYARSGDPLPAR